MQLAVRQENMEIREHEVGLGKTQRLVALLLAGVFFAAHAEILSVLLICRLGLLDNPVIVFFQMIFCKGFFRNLFSRTIF